MCYSIKPDLLYFFIFGATEVSNQPLLHGRWHLEQTDYHNISPEGNNCLRCKCLRDCWRIIAYQNDVKKAEELVTM